MIYLFTGQPGAGKTLTALNRLEKMSEHGSRNVYICGVELTEEFPVRYKSVTYDDLELWPDFVEDNSIVFIDEAQKIFRPRSSSSKVPYFVSELETHRHRGLDFIVVTQYPNLIDSHFAGLVGQHTHLSLSPLGQRRLLTWDRLASPRVKSDVSEAKKTFEKLPKHVFGWYKSSVNNRLHVSRKSIVKPVLYGSIILFFVCLLMSFQALKGMKSNVENSTNLSASGVVAASSPAGVSKVDVKKESGASVKDPTSEPHTADPKTGSASYMVEVKNEWERSAYDGGFEPYDSPVPVGCVSSKRTCNCYSERGRLLKVEDKLCRKIAAGEPLPFKFRKNSSESLATPVAPPLPAVSSDSFSAGKP